ncbi:MAG: MerR family transcriptional regulator [Candidatus Omnitrophota bacterium]
MEKQKFKISHLAKELKIAIQTIKNYEAMGIIPKARKDDKGWRYYTKEDIIKIKALYEQDIRQLKHKKGIKKLAS